MTADVLDFAQARAQRGLPVPRPADPPVGFRRGDRVRGKNSGALGTVLGGRWSRVGITRSAWMLTVQFPGVAAACLIDDLEPAPAPGAVS